MNEPVEPNGVRPAPSGQSWPRGHGLQRPASGACWCGRAVLSCAALTGWAARRRALLIDTASHTEETGMRGRLRAGRASAEAPPGDLSRISIDVERIQVETRRLGHHDGVVEWRLVSPWSGSPLPAPNAQ